MADLRAEIANLPIIGEEWSQQFVDHGRTFRNHIRWKLSRTTIDLFQRPVVFGRYRDLDKRSVHTTTLFVRNVPAARRKKAERLVSDLCYLLSFATLSEVRPFAYAYNDIVRRFSTSGITMRFRPPIESDGEAVRKFVDCTWNSYRRLSRTRKLHEVFQYLTLAEHPNQPVEVRLLLAFVVLENLKGTWAHQHRIPFIKHFFRKPPKTGVAHAKSPSYSFRDLLTLMFAEQGMKPALRRIIKVRNQIVHFGLSPRTLAQNAEYYDRSRGIVHEYLLRLLGYRGDYLDYRLNHWRRI